MSHYQSYSSYQQQAPTYSYAAAAQPAYSSYGSNQYATSIPVVVAAAPSVQAQSYVQQAYSSAAQQSNTVHSQVEQAVIAAQQPIASNEREQVQAGPYRGTFLNKQEVDNWRGPVPIEQYRINEDPNPEVIRKRLDKVRYQQEVAVKYLQPPSPPRPGDLVIRERQSQIPPAPPVVLRQEANRACTPPPVVHREHPPRPPPQIPEQVIEVDGAPVPPPARRVVVEKLTNLPPKPQNIIIEKWLPYKQQRRRVVFQRACAQCPPPNPRNLVIEWEAPDVEVEQVCRDMGVQNACPEDYVRRYGCELKQPCEMPQLCQCQRQQCGCENNAPELEGDVHALRYVDLEANGLSEYRRYVQ